MHWPRLRTSLNLLLIFATPVFAAGPGKPTAAETLAIGRISPSPALDGSLADWPTDSARFLLGENSQTGVRSTWNGTADLAGKILLAWDDDYLYLGAEVVDDKLNTANGPAEVWQGDTFELFFNTHPLQQRVDGFWQQAIVPPLKAGETLKVTGPQKDFTGVDGAVKLQPKGYSLEVRIPWENLDGFKPATGTALGFQLYLDDRDGKGRKTQLIWHPSSITFSHPQETHVLVLRDRGDTSAPQVLAGPTTYLVTDPRQMDVSAVTDVAGARSAVIKAASTNAAAVPLATFDLQSVGDQLRIGRASLSIEGLTGPQSFEIQILGESGQTLTSSTFTANLDGAKFQKMRTASEAVKARIKALADRKDLDATQTAGLTAWWTRINGFVSNEARPEAMPPGLLEAMLSEYAALDSAIAELEAGKDPYAGRTGSLVRAYRSPLTGEFRPYALWIPETPIGGTETRRPLIVLLHSIFGDERMLTLLTETFRNLGAIVYQGASYRQFDWGGVSAAETWAALKEVEEHYPIDPDRRYLVGCHIGGRGTWQLAEARPDLWAALGPIYSGIDTQPDYPALALYPQFYEIAKNAQLPSPQFKPPAAPEPLNNPLLKKLYRQNSLVTRLENIAHLPIWSAYGEDAPPAAAERLAMQERLAELRTPFQTRYVPGAMHGSQPDEFRNPDFFRQLLAFRRPAYPRSVKYVVTNLRDSSAWWVGVDQLTSPDAVATIEAVVEADRIRVKTQGAAALSLLPDARLAENAPELEIDGQTLGTFPLATSPEWRHFIRRDGKWIRGTVPDTQKHPGLSGPINDFQRDRFIFVYGTQGDDAQKSAAKKQAEKLANWGLGAQFLIRADSEITDADLAGANLILIGTPASNALLAKMEAQLPLRWSNGGLALGKSKIEGPGAGACFIVPNPLSPKRYAIILTATDEAGYQIWNSRNPGGDYVLGRMENTEEKPAFRTQHRGWFTNDWQWDAALNISSDE